MSTLTVGTIAEKVVDAGVSIDGVTLKDSTIIVGADTLTPAQVVQKNIQNTFTASQIPSTQTEAFASLSSAGVFNFDLYQNFIITLASGANTLESPTTEALNVGQTGVFIFIQPASGTAGTISFDNTGDYETAESAGLTLSSALNAYDIVPYIIKADNSILLGTPQLNFG
tara:strand:- start:602 stop:1111 length:510 start_codon:yes stop_codon:yes gene_type:complete